jgi:hypothetical protein
LLVIQAISIMADMTPEQQEIMDKLNYRFAYHRNRYVDGQAIRDDDDFIALLPHLANLIPFDWVNNEGGYGTYTFDFDNGTVHLDSHENVQSTNDYEDDF